jgi:hypothetical protein
MTYSIAGTKQNKNSVILTVIDFVGARLPRSYTRTLWQKQKLIPDMSASNADESPHLIWANARSAELSIA